MGLHDLYDSSLEEAVRFCDFESVLDLLNKGHDPNTIGLYKWTSLHEAAHNGEDEILRILLNKRGDPNKADELNLSTPLHYAAREGHEECVRLLLKAGSKVKVTNVDGETPHDLATGQCWQLLQEAFVKENEADINSNNSNSNSRNDTPNANNNNVKLLPRRDVDAISNDGISDVTSVSDSLDESFDSFMSTQSFVVGETKQDETHSSTISGVYVKCFLLPDHSSKQRTEIVRIHQSGAHKLPTDASHQGVEHVFTPTSVSFTKPLCYSSIDATVIRDNRRLRFEVCLMQRYTRKSFLVAMMSVDVKDAVKQLLRVKYPITPCSNPTIPLSMTVHSGACLRIPSAKSHSFHSNPELNNLSLTSLQTARASSDLDLHTVVVSRPQSPMVAIAMPVETESESIPLTTISVLKSDPKPRNVEETKLNMDLDTVKPRIIDMGPQFSDEKQQISTVKQQISEETSEISETKVNMDMVYSLKVHKLPSSTKSTEIDVDKT